jgi:hypothetical protein
VAAAFMPPLHHRRSASLRGLARHALAGTPPTPSPPQSGKPYGPTYRRPIGRRAAIQAPTAGPQSCQAPTAPAPRPPALAAPPPAAICPKTTEPGAHYWAGSWPKIRVVAASGWRRGTFRGAAGSQRDQHDLERCARAVRRLAPPPRAGRGAERAPSPPSPPRFFVAGASGGESMGIICPLAEKSRGNLSGAEFA